MKYLNYLLNLMRLYMGMNNSFLAGYLAEKEVRKCSKISLKERSTVYLLNFVPPMDCVAYQVDGNIIKGA